MPLVHPSAIGPRSLRRRGPFLFLRAGGSLSLAARFGPSDPARFRPPLVYPPRRRVFIVSARFIRPPIPSDPFLSRKGQPPSHVDCRDFAPQTGISENPRASCAFAALPSRSEPERLRIAAKQARESDFTSAFRPAPVLPSLRSGVDAKSGAVRFPAG